jgi:hypothetical protein
MEILLPAVLGEERFPLTLGESREPDLSCLVYVLVRTKAREYVSAFVSHVGIFNCHAGSELVLNTHVPGVRSGNSHLRRPYVFCDMVGKQGTCRGTDIARRDLVCENRVRVQKRRTHTQREHRAEVVRRVSS